VEKFRSERVVVLLKTFRKFLAEYQNTNVKTSNFLQGHDIHSIPIYYEDFLGDRESFY